MAPDMLVHEAEERTDGLHVQGVTVLFPHALQVDKAAFQQVAQIHTHRALTKSCPLHDLPYALRSVLSEKVQNPEACIVR